MPNESKPKLRNRAELSLFLKYCKENFNVKDGKWCSLALASCPRFLTTKELLDGYLQQREWLRQSGKVLGTVWNPTTSKYVEVRDTENYAKFRGEKFCGYFQLNN